MKNCEIAEVCPHYESGDNKPPNNDVRNKIPCVKFLKMSCEMGVNIQIFLRGEGISCNIEKVKRLKGG